ncbi:hypothetical protein BLNAU_17333 [Blattamonas nauphoetae]|uniref:Uncharacterized protein n=1 Tax=Blattamonas nauphoetae TaxID=2049346 RepID=A0ABQ9X911_9EUKA|nr:hypothetical protein BLNAU_17333 [Blattamonas nauphoetae]
MGVLSSDEADADENAIVDGAGVVQSDQNSHWQPPDGPSTHKSNPQSNSDKDGQGVCRVWWRVLGLVAHQLQNPS